MSAWRQLRLHRETWPLAGRFAISRGSRTASEVVMAEIEQDGRIGRGECSPYPRYGESVGGVLAAIEGLRGRIEGGLDRAALQDLLPAGAARNALDCALWDLEAKLSGRPVWQLAGLDKPRPITTAYTLSLDTAENMGAAAKANAMRPLLKLKLAGPADLDRVRAVHANAPKARLIVDANEGWTPEIYADLAPKLKPLGVELIEQPFAQADDTALERRARPIAVCADESCHDRASLAHIAGRYDAINIKLDKTGGLTEALALKEAARRAGYRLMAGCMLGTSLAMAPALLVAQDAEIVDLDGPLLLARDRTPGLLYEGSQVSPADGALWG
jgi:L-alanine-DL-glutamate epimerase-like enolase superfamily enzyme